MRHVYRVSHVWTLDAFRDAYMCPGNIEKYTFELRKIIYKYLFASYASTHTVRLGSHYYVQYPSRQIEIGAYETVHIKPFSTHQAKAGGS